MFRFGQHDGCEAIVGADGNFVAVSRGFCEIVKREEEPLLRLTMRELTYSDDVAPGLEKITALLRGTVDVT